MNITQQKDTIGKMLSFAWKHRIFTALLFALAIYATQFFILQLPQAQAAYSISNSLRFNNDDSATLSRTPGGAGTSRATTTVSMWVKRGDITNAALLELGSAGSDATYARVYFNSSDKLVVAGYNFSWRITTQVFRDPAQWGHLVITYDTSEPIANNRIKVYWNGNQITTFDTINNPSQGDQMPWGSTGLIRIGGMPLADAAGYFEGYLSDVYIIDGQALTPLSFGELDSNGYWRPKAYTGTYGSHGVHLDFSNSGAYGTDSSGNGNTFTANNLDTTDQEIDTPTNFFPTFNSVWKSSSATYSQGNLTTTSSGASIQITNFTTMGMTTGKWYWEVSNDNVGANINSYLGIANTAHTPSIRAGFSADSWVYIPSSTGNCIGGANSCKATNSSITTYGPSYASVAATRQVYGFAFDADTGKLFVRDGTGWIASSDPVAGTSPMFSSIPTTTPLFPVTTHDSVGSQATGQTMNFGQSKNSTSTATTLTYDSSAGGYFHFTPPSGYKALSTANLPTPAVTVPKNYFDTLLYPGTGAAKSVGATTTAGTSVTVFLTSGTTWEVPHDWNSASNTIEVIGGGGAGREVSVTFGAGSGGGGGAYSRSSNVPLTPGAAVTYAVGSGGLESTTPTAGGDTYLCNSTSNCASIAGTAVMVGAKGGAAAGTGNGPAGTGGAAASGVGSVKYSGGSGGLESIWGGGGGGGAAGPSGDGKAGGPGSSATQGGGGGGGGSNNGSAGGADTTTTSGSNGGNGPGGSGGGSGGGAATNGTAGTANTGSGGGGGGGITGGTAGHGAAGSGDDIWAAAIGPGGGGGGGGGASSGNPAGAGGDGAIYGGGGGGAATNNSGTSNTTGGNGGQGIIKITYVSTGPKPAFQPSLAWLKDRSATNVHGLFDFVRKVFPYLSSNATTAETATASTTLTSFLSSGFSLGSSALFNTNTNTYVSWNWKESTTAGFDVVNYVGTGANRTISHSLGVAPDLIIVKDRQGTNDWAVYHSANTSAPETDYLLLNSTAATADLDTYWNDTLPTSAVFSLGTNADVNFAGNNYTAYLFASTTGFSSFGTFTGNGSADGPFIYTGFKPKFVMLKRGSGVSSWVMLDGGRNPTNPAIAYSYAEANSAESPDGASTGVDFLANGFKLRESAAGWNGSGSTLLYAAFAEIPFQQSALPYNFTIASSTRFDSAALSYLDRTPGVAGNRKTWTASFWVKRANFGETYKALFPQAGTGGSAQGLAFVTGDKLEFDYTNNNVAVRSTRVFRDPAKWYHIVVRMDTTQASASDRFRIWVDNEEITVWDTDARSTAFAQNSDQSVNNTVLHTIGTYSGGALSTYVPNSYLSDAYLIDGQALSPTDFAEYDTNGYWRPKAYTGSYGTNGFHLPLTSTSPGDDTGSNNADWTATNFDATDNVKDSPTNSFATLNSIDPSVTAPSNGNLLSNSLASKSSYSTLWFTSGKWYWEARVNALSGTANHIGVMDQTYLLTSNTWSTQARSYNNNAGNKYNGSSTAYGNSWTTGDVIGVALDMDNGKIWFSKNGVWQASGDPAAGTNAAFTDLVGKTWRPFYYGQNATYNVNFGQGGTTTVTYDSASGGYFAYTPPTGFKALSTANLAASPVTQPDDYFDVLTYTGTGAALSVTGLDFMPTLTWIKDRTSANAHGLFDSLRAVFPYLSSNATTAETATASTTLTAFNANGFSLGTSTVFNTSGNNYVSWLWKESTTAGFDIVTYTGTGSNRTISHALGATPDLMIIKDRAGTNDWSVYHSANTSAPETDYLLLNSTAATADLDTYWNDTAPTASVFSLGTNADVNTSGNDYVAYLFDEVTGYSDFGYYTGNGSADGPFVYTGFKPRFILIKQTVGGTGEWFMYDTARNAYNPVDEYFMAQSNAAIATLTTLDVLSNGFKIRTTNTSFNDTGDTYVYAAFAETPFKYSAAPASAATVVSSFVQAVALMLGMEI